MHLSKIGKSIASPRANSLKGPIFETDNNLLPRDLNEATHTPKISEHCCNVEHALVKLVSILMFAINVLTR